MFLLNLFTFRIVYLLPPDYDACMSAIKHFEIDQENLIRRTRLLVFVPKEVSFFNSYKRIFKLYFCIFFRKVL